MGRSEGSGALPSEFFISARHQAVCVSMATRYSRTIEASCVPVSDSVPVSAPEEWLVPIGAERSKCLQPLGRHPASLVRQTLLHLCRFPGFALYAWVTDGHEAPRLAVGPRRGRGAIRIASSMQARDTGF